MIGFGLQVVPDADWISVESSFIKHDTGSRADLLLVLNYARKIVWI
jgi:hypothetical protein